MSDIATEEPHEREEAENIDEDQNMNSHDEEDVVEEAGSDEEEIIIGDSPENSQSFILPDGESQQSNINIQVTTGVNICQAFFVDFTFFKINSNKFRIIIPTSFLPFTISTVNGFTNPILLEAEFEVSSDWNFPPINFSLLNPDYGSKFPGSVLVSKRIQEFFQPNYCPAPFYQAQAYALTPPGQNSSQTKEKLIIDLVSQGFDIEKAKKALHFCRNNYKEALDYLITGQLPHATLLLSDYSLPSYQESPIPYLVLEICEAFFDMGNSCCVCGKPLGIYGLKPSPCSDELCQFSFLQLGVGASIVSEIRRDPLATDFIITVAAAAYSAPLVPPVFDPAPKNFGNVAQREADIKKYEQLNKKQRAQSMCVAVDFNGGLQIPMSQEDSGIKFFSDLPSMEEMAKCQTDGDLISYIGQKKFEFLRFFILANRAHLATLPEHMKVKVGLPIQFLLTSRSPEAELEFEGKRQKYGTKWLWHGSNLNRWYRILHTGLKDYNLTGYQTHGGPIHGMGIYMSPSRNYSLGYCVPAHNLYKKSALPKMFSVISLVENADVPLLKKAVDMEYTQRDEAACITRVLCLNPTNPEGQWFFGCNTRMNDVNVIENPPKVPTLHDVLMEIGTKATISQIK